MRKIFLLTSFVLFFAIGCSKHNPNSTRVIKVLKEPTTPVVYFDFNKSNIKPEYFPILDDVAVMIKETPQLQKIYIEGFSNSKEKYKLKLSQKRAEEVMQYLMNRTTLDKTRLEPIGYGDKYPLSLNSDSEKLRRNSRVEFNAERRTSNEL